MKYTKLIVYTLASILISCSSTTKREVNYSAYRVPSSVSDDSSCKQIATELIENNQVNEELAKLSGIKYLTQKMSEIKHLDSSNLYAMQLRLLLVTSNSGKVVEEVPLSKLKAIHPINRGASLEKTKARAANIKSYVDTNGLPKVFNTDIQEETIKSRLLMRAVKTDNEEYIIFDGNGRLFALREYFENHDLAEMPIEVEVYKMDYSKIKHLVEIRRKHLYETGEDVSKVREILYHPELTEADLDFMIEDLKFKSAYYRKVSKKTSDKDARVEFANMASDLGQGSRQLENIKLWRKNGYAFAYKQGITEEEINNMVLKKVPLGFTKEVFEEAKLDLVSAMRTEQISGGYIVLDGSSTTFYSENPSKKLGHHFKAKGLNKSDYDFKLYSTRFADLMKERGYKWGAHEGHFKAKWLEREFPAVKEFNEKWSKKLNRKVTVIGVDEEVRKPSSYGQFIIDFKK